MLGKFSTILISQIFSRLAGNRFSLRGSNFSKSTTLERKSGTNASLESVFFRITEIQNTVIDSPPFRISFLIDYLARIKTDQTFL